MKIQHQVILSLGSNQGKKLVNIEKCIDLLHNEVGTIVKVSSLYESKSWGFESDDFYNCAVLMHTNFSPSKLLKKILRRLVVLNIALELVTEQMHCILF